MDDADRWIFAIMYFTLATMNYFDLREMKEHRDRTETQIQALVRCAYMEEDR